MRMTNDSPAALRTLAVVGFFLIATGTADATEYFLRVSGNDSNDGRSAAAAFRTWNKAAPLVGPGDVVYVGAGTYTESVFGLRDGTAGNAARWLADSAGARTGDAGTVTLRPADGGGWALRLLDEQYITFRGVRFAANPNASNAVGVLSQDSVQNDFAECTFDGLSIGLRAEVGQVDVGECTFANCGTSIYSDRANVDLDDSTLTGAAVTTHLRVLSSYVLSRNSTFAGADYAIYQSTGTACQVLACDISGASVCGLWTDAADVVLAECDVADCGTGVSIHGEDFTLDRCSVARCDTGVRLAARAGAATEVLKETAIVDCPIGLYTERNDPAPENLTISGSTTAGIWVDAAMGGAFTLIATETVTCTNCTYGLLRRPNGSAAPGSSLHLAAKSWTGNVVAVFTDRVADVLIEDCTFTGGSVTLASYYCDDCTYRRVTTVGGGLSGSWRGLRAGAVVGGDAVEFDDCTFRDGHAGAIVWPQGGVSPDLHDTAFTGNADAGLWVWYGPWRWDAADALTVTGNKIGVSSHLADLTIDGGAPGITVAGNTAGGVATVAVYAHGGSAALTNVHAADSNVGFDLREASSATLLNCSATGCPEWGANLRRNASAGTAVAAVRTFTATDCGNGLQYDHDDPADAGGIVLEQIAVTRPTAYRADGTPTAAAGTGVHLQNCGLDPTLHAGLTVRGHSIGLSTADAAANGNVVTAAVNLDVRGCSTGLYVQRAAISITGWTARENETALYTFGDDDAGDNHVTLADCDLWGRDRAADLRSFRDTLTAVNCTFEGAKGDAASVDGGNWGDPRVEITDCDFHGDDDGLVVLCEAAAPGVVNLTRCTVGVTRDDGFVVNRGSLTATDCGTHAPVQDQLFRLIRCDATLVRCVADHPVKYFVAQDAPGSITATDCSAPGGVGFRGFHIDGADRCTFTRCHFADVGSHGWYLRSCDEVTVLNCSSRGHSGIGLEIAYDADAVVTNFLAVGPGRGLMVRDESLTLNHATLVSTGNNPALHVLGGAVTARNCVLVSGGGRGTDRADGTLALDHVLIHAPAPYANVTPGPDDVVAAPLFRDAAAGDYRLAEGSPAINAGRDLSGTVDEDLLGAARPSYRRHDLGAYEYQEAGGSLRILHWKERAK